jgi:ribosomal protein S18 acetylase RimI-like enzyme
MWVSPAARGLGIGRRILSTLEQQARDAGLDTLRLETNESLREAQSLYRSAGYREVPAFNREPYAHHWFEKKRLRPVRRSAQRLNGRAVDAGSASRTRGVDGHQRGRARPQCPDT